MKTGNQEIDEWHDEMTILVEDTFKVMGRVGGKKPAVTKKIDIFLRAVKIHHLEEEIVLRTMSGSLSSDLVADHKKAHRELEERLKEIMGELKQDLEEGDFLNLKREVRRLLTSHIIEWDLPTYGPKSGKA
ncbi:MAG: hemerythrin domain-containing protein [Alphaproteobacteria bacterium]|nr:hemerythrin domain-containing protein [Alphaproteobacteria bacterium]